jgi:Zn-dependent oligopeptidase
MYATVFKKNSLAAVLGNAYRDKILLVGGSQDETVSL